MSALPIPFPTREPHEDDDDRLYAPLVQSTPNETRHAVVWAGGWTDALTATLMPTDRSPRYRTIQRALDEFDMGNDGFADDGLYRVTIERVR